ncbi:MAG: alpha/beta hydrolase fold domain-containing protein [Bacteroidaceae bacterium]|nr:alpha/beta hydrolase fold domain-containing protein [Bacteroidaceae bacterium]
MKKAITILALAFTVSAFAQQEIRLYDGVAPGSEGVQDNERINRAPDGTIQTISGVVTPSITIYLPSADKATGTAVILCSGGGLMSHSWSSDVINMARWLNERGIAAIGLKYRTRVMSGGPGGPRMGGGGQALSASVTEFSKITKSNANPDTSESGIKNIDNAINDALRAMEIVREHAAEWHINPDKIGYLGFSAGGGVGIGATVRADAQHRPAFMATIYGPSLIDVEVPENAPKLFIATRGDHHNVAAGLVSLYLDWKRAGANAEMHLYDDGTGPFGPDDPGNTSGTWRESFYRWITYNRF